MREAPYAAVDCVLYFQLNAGAVNSTLMLPNERRRAAYRNAIIVHPAEASSVNNTRHFSTKVHARRDKADRYFIRRLPTIKLGRVTRVASLPRDRIASDSTESYIAVRGKDADTGASSECPQWRFERKITQSGSSSLEIYFPLLLANDPRLIRRTYRCTRYPAVITFSLYRDMHRRMIGIKVGESDC